MKNLPLFLLLAACSGSSTKPVPPAAEPDSTEPPKSQLVEDDDQLVVMTAGDEIVIRFEAPEQQLPNGWRRDFVLHSVGWDKDADINTLAGQTSLPLPFKEQEAYPPPPEHQEQAQQALEKNEATLTRQRQWRPSGRIQ